MKKELKTSIDFKGNYNWFHSSLEATFHSQSIKPNLDRIIDLTPLPCGKLKLREQ